MYRFVPPIVYLMLVCPQVGTCAGFAYDVNFHVFADTQQVATVVLKQANQYRTKIAEELLEIRVPDGIGKTTIHVSHNVDKGERAFVWPIGPKSRRTMLTMYINAEPENVIDVLPHEIAHIVMKARYLDKIPCWVEEGIACRYDNLGRKLCHDEVYKWCREVGRWPDLDTLLAARTINSNDTQSYMLSVYLVNQIVSKGEKLSVLLQHASHGNDTLQQHYNLKGIYDGLLRE